MKRSVLWSVIMEQGGSSAVIGDKGSTSVHIPGGVISVATARAVKRECLSV